jgi:hypothetical protein
MRVNFEDGQLARSSYVAYKELISLSADQRLAKNYLFQKRI